MTLLSAADQVVRCCHPASLTGAAALATLSDVAALLCPARDAGDHPPGATAHSQKQPGSRDVAWEVLLQRAAECHAGRVLHLVLETLEKTLGVTVPAGLTARLATLPGSRFEAGGTLPVAGNSTCGRAEVAAGLRPLPAYGGCPATGAGYGGFPHIFAVPVGRGKPGALLKRVVARLVPSR